MRVVFFRTSHGFLSKKRILTHSGNKMSLKRKIFIFHGRMNFKDSSYETKNNKIIFSKRKITTSISNLKFNYLGRD